MAFRDTKVLQLEEEMSEDTQNFNVRQWVVRRMDCRWLQIRTDFDKDNSGATIVDDTAKLKCPRCESENGQIVAGLGDAR